MTLLYADTSALIRAYFADEPDHDEMREMLLEGDEPVVSSEVARVEFASAVRTAAAGGRLRRWRRILEGFDADCQEDGPIGLLRLHPEAILPAARELVLKHKIRTLDAVHLAVAVEEGPALAPGGDVALVTRDDEQAAAARSLGLLVR